LVIVKQLGHRMGRRWFLQVNFILTRFRMRRGTDESAIESMAEAATPYLVHKKEHNESFL
jgi:hypothetical protein